MGEEPGIGVDHALGVERFEHATQPLAERMQPHERQKALDQALRSLGNALEVGQVRAEPFDRAGMAAEHGDRQVAKAHVFGEHGQQRLDDARPETVADHHAVDVARIERARRALDAERADHADPLADGDRKRRIGAAAAGEQHGRLVERIARRQFGRQLAARGQRAGAAQDRACKVRMRSAEPSRLAIRSAGALAAMVSASGTRRRVVLARAGDHRRERTVPRLEPIGKRLGARGAIAQGSASTTASGSTDANAAAASAQLVSTMGKAPAARNASTTSGAGLSATTTNGPCSAIGACRQDANASDCRGPCQSAVNGPSTADRNFLASRRRRVAPLGCGHGKPRRRSD